MSRNRPAPIATRTAISFCRAAALASRSVARFAQAISKTMLTTLIRMRKGNENWFLSRLSPWLPEASTRLSSESRRCVSGVSLGPASAIRNCWKRTLSVACACCSEIPGFNRPIT